MSSSASCGAGGRSNVGDEAAAEGTIAGCSCYEAQSCWRRPSWLANKRRDLEDCEGSSILPSWVQFPSRECRRRRDPRCRLRVGSSRRPLKTLKQVAAVADMKCKARRIGRSELEAQQALQSDPCMEGNHVEGRGPRGWSGRCCRRGRRDKYWTVPGRGWSLQVPRPGWE